MKYVGKSLINNFLVYSIYEEMSGKFYGKYVSKLAQKAKYKMKKKVAKPVKDYVKTAIHDQIEDKFFSTGFLSGAFTPTQAGALQIVNNMTQGTNKSNRIGNKVKITKVNMKFVYRSGLATTGQWVREMLIWDKQTNGVALTPTDVLQSSSATLNFNAPYNPNTVPSRYTILRDKLIWVDIAGGLTDIPMEKKSNRTIKVNKSVNYYDSNVGTVADITKGSLYFVCFTDVTAAQPVVKGIILVHYEDA